MQVFATEEPRKLIESISTGAKSPEEILGKLDELNIEYYVTEEGNLALKYWQIYEGFVSQEHVAIIRSARGSSGQGEKIDWLSKNLQTINEKYSGQWVAIQNDEVVAHSPNLQDLLSKIDNFDKPLVTFIPKETIVWTFTYDFQRF